MWRKRWGTKTHKFNDLALSGNVFLLFLAHHSIRPLVSSTPFFSIHKFTEICLRYKAINTQLSHSPASSERKTPVNPTVVFGSMQLQSSVTDQHTPLFPALSFNYFPVFFSLPLSLLPSLHLPLFFCDYTKAGSHCVEVKQGLRTKQWKGVFIGQQVV